MTGIDGGRAGRPVVIVDAFEDEREMYEEALRYGGYDVIACEEIADTLRVVREAPAAVVLTRIVQGPGAEWNGVELTRQLRSGDDTKHIPIIVMTTRIEPSWRTAAEYAGCDGFLMLPCTPDAVLAEVRRVTGTRGPEPSPQPAATEETLFVWRLFSPSARQLTCQMRPHDGRFELLIADDRDQEIIRTSFDDVTELHQKAEALRISLEEHGYVAAGYAREVGLRMGVPSEGRTAFCGLIACAELLSLDKRDVGSPLRDAATIGLVAVGLQDVQMTKAAVARSREALGRARGRRASDRALIESCDALLARVERAVAQARATVAEPKDGQGPPS